MGGSASKADEDNIKLNYQVPGTLGGIARIFVEKSESIVSIIFNAIMSNEGYKEELYDLVEQFLSYSKSLSAFCNELESCLNKARDSHLNLDAAVECFKEGRRDGANGCDKYKSALEELKKFKNSENPFTGLPEILEKVRQQQQELQKNIENYNKKIEEEKSKALIWRVATGCVFIGLNLTGIVFVAYSDLFLLIPVLETAVGASVAIMWNVNELFKSYCEGLERHQQLIGLMRAQGIIETSNFDEIGTAAKNIGDQLESLKRNAEFTLEGEEKVVIGFELIEQKIDRYAESIKECGKCIKDCREVLKTGREKIRTSMGTKT